LTEGGARPWGRLWRRRGGMMADACGGGGLWKTFSGEFGENRRKTLARRHGCFTPLRRGRFERVKRGFRPAPVPGPYPADGADPPRSARVGRWPSGMTVSLDAVTVAAIRPVRGIPVDRNRHARSREPIQSKRYTLSTWPRGAGVEASECYGGRKNARIVRFLPSASCPVLPGLSDIRWWRRRGGHASGDAGAPECRLGDRRQGPRHRDGRARSWLTGV